VKAIPAAQGFASKLRASIAYFVILGVAIYLYQVAEHFQYEIVPGRIGPDAWPKIVLVLLMATCVWRILRTLLFGAPTASPDDVEEDAPVIPAQAANVVHLAWIGIGITVVYVYLMPSLGFFAATVLFIAAIASIAGRYRKPLPLAASAVIAPIVLMFVFMRIVYIALPLGHGPFKDLTLFLLKLLGVH
jgi:putative tricarboxylic transport membrane protein